MQFTNWSSDVAIVVQRSKETPQWKVKSRARMMLQTKRSSNNILCGDQRHSPKKEKNGIWRGNLGSVRQSDHAELIRTLETKNKRIFLFRFFSFLGNITWSANYLPPPPTKRAGEKLTKILLETKNNPLTIKTHVYL